MDASQIYILIGIVVLLIIAVLVIFLGKKSKNKKVKPLTPLAGLAFVFIITGILFSDSRLAGYSLMGIGVILAIVDMIMNLKK